MSLAKLQDDDLKKYKVFEDAVREYYDLPLDQYGQHDRSAREPIYGYCAANFNWDKPTTRSEIARVFQVIHCEQVGGTEKERAKLADAAADAKASLKTARPELEKQIREATAKLKELETASTQFDVRLAESKAAADKLQSHKLLPRPINIKIRDLVRQTVETGTGAVVQEIEQEINELETIIAGPIYNAELEGNQRDEDRTEADRRFAVWLQQKAYDDHIEVITQTDETGRVSYERKVKGLPTLQADAKQRLPELKKALTKAEKDHESHAKELETLRRHYIK